MTKALILSVCAAVLAGCATPTPAPDSRTAMAGSEASKAPLTDTQCVRDSGSLIKRTDGQCRNIAGRSYSQEDLQSTGQGNAADALRQLDPTIR